MTGLFKKDIGPFARGYALGSGSVPLNTDVFTENGTYTHSAGGGWKQITVNVPQPTPVLDTATFTANGTYTHGPGGGWNQVTVNVPQFITGAQSAADDPNNPYDPDLDPITIGGQTATPVPPGYTGRLPNGSYAYVNDDDPDNPIIIYVDCEAHITYDPPYKGGRMVYTMKVSYGGEIQIYEDRIGTANVGDAGYSDVSYSFTSNAGTTGSAITISSTVSLPSGQKLGNDSGIVGFDANGELGIPRGKTYKLYMM